MFLFTRHISCFPPLFFCFDSRSLPLPSFKLLLAFLYFLFLFPTQLGTAHILSIDIQHHLHSIQHVVILDAFDHRHSTFDIYTIYHTKYLLDLFSRLSDDDVPFPYVIVFSTSPHTHFFKLASFFYTFPRYFYVYV